MKIEKVNILGDSITWGYEAFTEKRLKIRYPDLLKEELQLQQVNQYGISGSTLASGENAFEPMCLRYKNMEEADMVIVFGGTNDYDPVSEKPICLGNKHEKNTETIYGAIHEICRGLREKYPTAILVFMTPLKRGYENENAKLELKTKVKNDLGYTLEDVGKAIKEVCQMYEIDVFDLYEECGIEKTEDVLKYLPDGLHPTEEYHEILAKKLVNFIEVKYINYLQKWKT